MRKYLPVIGLLLLFLILKISNLSIKISDTNIYWYTAYKLTQGEMLYGDIFFTNLPLFPYLSALYFFLVGKQLIFYYLTSAIEVSITAFLIFLIVYKQTKKYIYALSSFMLYLFSFMILSTSEHQTGVFAASLFATAGYYLFTKNKCLLSGILLSLSLLTKAYFLPIIATIFLITIFKNARKEFLRLLIGFIGTTAFFLMPFLLFTQNEFINSVFTYSLTRSAGLDKTQILWFFITKDFFFFILLLFNLIFIKRNLFFGIFSLLSILFFFWYKDTYYLYLNFLAPFLALSAPSLFEFIEKNFSLQKMVIPTIIFLGVFVNLALYFLGFRDLQKISNYSALTNTIREHKPEYLYGVNDTTPALAYNTNTPLLNNVIDTNANIFRKKFLDAKKLTRDAITNKTILVTHGAVYPELRVEEHVIDEIFDKELIKKSCKLIKSVPVVAEGYANRISLLKCY
ncbi:MAG: hypothetical protein HYU49_00210 [Candidatus Levybacteria bacterium]|nr:hypothetical protein [Candidatus Levybacteria bacterium]